MTIPSYECRINSCMSTILKLITRIIGYKVVMYKYLLYEYIIGTYEYIICMKQIYSVHTSTFDICSTVTKACTTQYEYSN